MGSWLTAEQARQYGRLTTASLALSLDGIAIPDAVPLPRSGQIFAAGQTFAGLPAALVMVRTSSATALEVLSLAVLEPYRKLGLATQLLAWLWRESRRLGFLTLSLSYPLDHASTAAMARLTDPQKGWRLSEGLRLVHLDRAGGFALVRRLEALRARWHGSDRFALVPWQALNRDHHRQIHALQQKAPSWAWPAHGACEGGVGFRDDAISHVLLDQQAVIGWLIAHRVGRSLLRVTQWWVTPQWQGRGVSMLMLYQVCVGALEAEPVYNSFSFGIAQHSTAMRQLCNRHLEPNACGVQLNQLAILTDGGIS
jgi:GNAT superfamily N-acetyltransferase